MGKSKRANEKKIINDSLTISVNHNKNAINSEREQNDQIENNSMYFVEENLNLSLDILRSEYISEIERSSRLDTKVNIALSVIVVLFPLIFNQILDKMYIYLRNIYCFKWGFIEILLLTIMILCITLVSYLYKALFARPFEHINSQDLCDECKLKSNTGELKMMYIKAFYDYTKNNRKSNNNKAKLINKSVKFMLSAFLLFILILFITIGGNMDRNKKTSTPQKTSQEIVKQAPKPLKPRPPEIVLEDNNDK